MAQIHKVLVSDKLAESGLAPLRADATMQVDVRTGMTEAELIESIPDYEALLVRSATTVTAPIIQAGKNLRVIARAGVGVDNIDIDAATQAGIIVVNAPTGNTIAAAEHTVAMLMALARNIPQAHGTMQAGEWKRGLYVGTEVRDKVLGSVGLGRVAQEVVQRAQGLGMRIIAYDPYVNADFAAQRGVKMLTLDELLAQADFVSLHVPLTPQTRHQINADKLALMKPTARIINVARGGVIDEHALVEAIQADRLAGAALDVFESEPLSADSLLLQCDKIIVTPHLGASTVEAQELVAEQVAVQVIDILNDQPARYAVNAPIIPPKDLDFLIPYIDLAERLGRFLIQLAPRCGREIQITAHGPLADFEQSYINAAVIKGLLADIVQVRVNLVNAQLLAQRRDMNLVEHKRHQHEARYENMLTLSTHCGSQTWTVRGSVLQGEPYIVGINDLWVDFPAAGNMLVSGHQDRPGIIGRVGTRLGQEDVNISFMHVGRSAPRTEAIMVIGTDEIVYTTLQSEIEGYEYINWLTAVTL